MPFTTETALTGTQFKPGQSGNLAGKPKGTKHITTYIQELMEKPDFEARILDPKAGLLNYKGKPIHAVLQVVLTKAVNGDPKMIEVLMKYGWSQKIDTDLTSGGEKIDFNAAQADQLIRARAERSNT